MAWKEVSKKISESLFFLSLGGTIYYGIEIVFRGFSHWTMFCVGGVVFAFCTFQGALMKWKEPLWIQVVRAVTFAISLEFITGIIFNKWLKKQIWDYSSQPFQLWGQICLPFAVFFSGLIVIAILLGGNIAHYVFREAKPHFFIL